jgi:putative membrane protein
MYSMHADTSPDETASAVASQPLTGHAMDSHMSWLRTRMSTERTMMSWNRTSLSLISFGFTIYQFFDKLQQATVGAAAARPEAPRNLGLALMIAGTLGTFVALWQHYRMEKYLSGDQFKGIAATEGLPHWSLPFATTVLLALIGLIATAWVALAG